MGQAVDLEAAVCWALRAPSVHNTQPWRWRIRSGVVELHADWTRHLPWTDPDRRDLYLSCGAALHHLRVALAAQGLVVRVDRLPDPERSGHLASVTVSGGDCVSVDRDAAALCAAIERRRTERRQMSRRPVPTKLLGRCVEQACREGAELVAVTEPGMRAQLVAAIGRAAREQAVVPGYGAELNIWTRRYAGSRDGVSMTNVAAPPAGLAGSSPLRRFPLAGLPQPRQPATEGGPDDAAELLVLLTEQDDELAWLRAGEAASAVLLCATLAGLATTPLSQPVEVGGSRLELRRQVLRRPDYPQLLIRLGWPASRAEELPVTPRRDLRSVLLPG